MTRHSNPPGQPLTALYLLHVGSMDARLIGLSVERHWKQSVRLASELESARVVLVDCDRPGVEAAFERLSPHPRIGVVCYAFHPKDHAQRFPNRVILGKPLNLEALPAILASSGVGVAGIHQRSVGILIAVISLTRGNDQDGADTGRCGSNRTAPGAIALRIAQRLIEPDDAVVALFIIRRSFVEKTNDIATLRGQ